MALPWNRDDNNTNSNPKVVGLEVTEREGKAALWLWQKMKQHAAGHATAGFVTREVATHVLRAKQSEIRLLVKHDFITECAGGWDINGWDEFQVADQEAIARRDKAKKAAAVRWSKSKTGARLPDSEV